MGRLFSFAGSACSALLLADRTREKKTEPYSEYVDKKSHRTREKKTEPYSEYVDSNVIFNIL